MRSVGMLLLGIAATCGNLRSAAADEAALPLLLQDDFEHGMYHWRSTDPDPAMSVWRIVPDGPEGNHVLRVTGPSAYAPPHRSPLSIAWLKDTVVGDFELSARLQSTNVAAGPHRDLCLFWGYQDPAHFYYVHLGARPDPAACQIFIVNDAPRTAITVDEAAGTPWATGWHEVKVLRRVEDGTMEVYFDDMTKPLMTARDTTFQWGQVGLGTFDDHGNFDEVVLRGERYGAAPQPGPRRLCQPWAQRWRPRSLCRWIRSR